MTKKKFAARAALVAAVVLAAFAAVGSSAQATAVPQVKIYLENNNHNPGTVTTSCGQHGPLLTTALFNDAVGANVVETAVVYAEPANPASGLGTIVFGPVDVPVAGHVSVTVPYQAGVTYDAVAVAKGDPLPASVTDLVGRLLAHPPTADNSQLFPSGYPTAPADCPTPTPKPTTTKPCAGEPDEAAAKCPCPTVPPVNNDALLAVPKCPPTSTPSTPATSSATPTSSVSSSTSATPTPTPLPSGTSTATSATTPAATPTSPVGPALAHTGASVLPYTLGALGLLVLGTGAIGYSRHARSRRSH